ncbi:MAG TPA: hypothetical protein VFC79_08960 [Tissierellaceae bacterium]|nr:hypothetical protein [Tissierellaceae bacterium]
MPYENMCKITDKIEGLARNDQNGEILILIAKLIDEKVNGLEVSNRKLSDSIEKLDEKISNIKDHSQEIFEIRKDTKTNTKNLECLQVVRFLIEYPKIGMLLLIVIIFGVVLAYFSGIDNIIQMIQ